MTTFYLSVWSRLASSWAKIILGMLPWILLHLMTVLKIFAWSQGSPVFTTGPADNLLWLAPALIALVSVADFIARRRMPQIRGGKFVKLILAFAVVYAFFALSTATNAGWYALAAIVIVPLVLRLTGIRRSGYAGFHFNPITWSYLFRPFVAALIGFGAALTAKLAVFLILVMMDFVMSFWFTPNPVDNPLTWAITLGLGAVLFLLGALIRDGSDDSESGVVLEVPETKKAGLLLWRGMPSPFGITIYLWSGKYPWIGRVLGFSLSDFASVNDEEAADEKQETGKREPFTDGSFFNMGEIVFPIWNDADAEKDSIDRKRILAPSNMGSEVETAITLILRVVNPKLLPDSTNPARAVGDQARQEWRELTVNFADTDLTKLHRDIDRLWLGNPIVTCFLSGSVAGLKPGSMIRNRAGQPLYEPVENGDIKAAEEKLKKKILEAAPEKQRNAVMENGEPQFTTVTVEHPITEALKENGLELVRVNFAKIDFSGPVKDAANLASSQESERVTQLANAKSAKAARKELQYEADEERDETAMTLAAAMDPGNKDGNIQFKGFQVPGLEKLAQALTALVANLTNEGKKK